MQASINHAAVQLHEGLARGRGPMTVAAEGGSESVGEAGSPVCHLQSDSGDHLPEEGREGEEEERQVKKREGRTRKETIKGRDRMPHRRSHSQGIVWGTLLALQRLLTMVLFFSTDNRGMVDSSTNLEHSSQHSNVLTTGSLCTCPYHRTYTQQGRSNSRIR